MPIREGLRGDFLCLLIFQARVVLNPLVSFMDALNPVVRELLLTDRQTDTHPHTGQVP